MKHITHGARFIIAVALAATPAGEQQQVQPGAKTTDPDMVYIVTGARTTGLYHRKDCPWVRDASSTQIFILHEAKERYFQAHCLCITGKEGTPPCAAAALSPTAAPVVSSTTSTSPPPAAASVPTLKTPAAAPAAVRQQCAATTQKGARCSRMADAGSAYCWQHKK